MNTLGRAVAITLVLGASSTPVLPSPALTEQAPPGSKFRGGPARQGYYDAPAHDTLPGVLWRFRAHGRVLSSPAVANGIVYFGSDDGHLYAVDATTGALRWQFETGGAVRSSPAVSNGRVYFGSYDGTFRAVSAATGDLVWQFATAGERRWRAANLDRMPPADQVHDDPWDFLTSSPAVVDGAVYFGTGEGVLHALDAGSGEQRWQFATGDTIHSSPAVVAGTVYFGNMESRLYAVDAETGDSRWHFQAATDAEAHNQHGLQSSAAVADGRVFIGGRDGAVHAVDAASGDRLWRHDTSLSWVLGSPAVGEGLVFFGTSDTNLIRAVDIRTGQTVWEYGAGSCVFSSPALVDGLLYVGTCGGELIAVDTSTGDPAWRFHTDARQEDRHGLLLSDGTVDSNKLFAGPYNAETAPGMVERLLDLGSIIASPVPHDGVIYVGSADGTVYALGAPPGD